MTDDQNKELIEEFTKLFILPTAAIGVFLRQAFCVLAQQPCIDRKALLDGLRSLKPEHDEGGTFQETYDVYKGKFIKSIDELP